MTEDSWLLVTNPIHMNYARGFGSRNQKIRSVRPRPMQALKSHQAPDPPTPGSALFSLDLASTRLATPRERELFSSARIPE